MLKFEDIRKEIINTGLLMLKSNMTVRTWGNISARIEGMELGYAALNTLQNRNAAILANHGCISVGRSLKEALKTALVVEKSAKSVIYSKILGRTVTLGKDDIDKMREFYLNSYGQA